MSTQLYAFRGKLILYSQNWNWLIERHRPVKDEFNGYRTRKSYLLHFKLTYIRNRLEDPIYSGLVTKNGIREAEKTLLVYLFTDLLPIE